MDFNVATGDVAAVQLVLSTDPAVRDGFQLAQKHTEAQAFLDSQQIPLCGMDFNFDADNVGEWDTLLSTDPAVRDGFQHRSPLPRWSMGCCSQQIPLCGMDFNATTAAQLPAVWIPLNRSRCAGWISTSRL